MACMTGLPSTDRARRPQRAGASFAQRHADQSHQIVSTLTIWSCGAPGCSRGGGSSPGYSWCPGTGPGLTIGLIVGGVGGRGCRAWRIPYPFEAAGDDDGARGAAGRLARVAAGVSDQRHNEGQGRNRVGYDLGALLLFALEQDQSLDLGRGQLLARRYVGLFTRAFLRRSMRTATAARMVAQPDRRITAAQLRLFDAAQAGLPVACASLRSPSAACN